MRLASHHSLEVGPGAQASGLASPRRGARS